MTGIIAAGVAGSVLAAGASMYASSKSSEAQGRALDAAEGNMGMQSFLQQMQQRRQYEMQTAGQTDAMGNKVIYHPERGWISLLSPEGEALRQRQLAAQTNEAVNYFGRGKMERDREFNRRQEEGATASPLLAAIKEGYGAPTKEGVLGANKIAGVTAVTENADNVRAGANMAQLRQGTGSIPLGKSLSDLDRAATGGVRTALARADAEGGPLFNQIQSDFVTGKLNPYDKLASRASNVENVPMPSSDVSSTLDGGMLQRAIRGSMATSNPYAGLGTQQATNTLIGAINGQKQLPWGTAIGGLTDNIKDIMKIFQNKGGSSPTKLYEDNTYSGRTSTGNVYG